MAEKSEREQPTKDRDERVAIPLDPEEALKGLLRVKPEQQAKEDGPTPSPDTNQD